MRSEGEARHSRDVTHLLLAYGDGHEDALDHVVPLIYEELRVIAHRHLGKERAGHTMSTTALVHEAYLKLADQTRLTPQNRLHFFAIASRVMRHILIDYARKHQAQKRGGGRPHTSLDNTNIVLEARAEELIDLDDALNRLATFDERMSQVVEYRFFGGMTIEETAQVLDVSGMTVKRDWKKAKAWLYRELRMA